MSGASWKQICWTHAQSECLKWQICMLHALTEGSELLNDYLSSEARWTDFGPLWNVNTALRVKMSPVLYVAFEEKKCIFSSFNVAQVCIGRRFPGYDKDCSEARQADIRRGGTDCSCCQYSGLERLSLSWAPKVAAERGCVAKYTNTCTHTGRKMEWLKIHEGNASLVSLLSSCFTA